MNLFAIIFIILIITVIVILVLNHFFLKSNIIWDDLVKAQTGEGGLSNMNPSTSTYSDDPVLPSNGLISYTTENTDTINNLAKNSGKTGLIVPNSAFPTILGSNFMFSIWFFIDDYNENISSCKYISSIIGILNGDLSPSLITFLTPGTNNLGIGILTSHSAQSQMNFYFIENIPLQKWNCLIISVTDRTMDIYLEGKLINSYILQNFSIPLPKSSMYIGSSDNKYYFNGFITRARYQNNGVNPEEAYSIYKEGISTSFTGDFLNKYRLKVGLYEYQNKVGGFTI